MKDVYSHDLPSVKYHWSAVRRSPSFKWPVAHGWLQLCDQRNLISEAACDSQERVIRGIVLLGRSLRVASTLFKLHEIAHFKKMPALRD
jgi:hypothetical protein